MRGRNYRHGMCYTTEYKTWECMKDRCLNANNKSFSNYGGRGIRVCDRWMKFENFLLDMKSKPSPAHSLDRFPDNNGDYEPGNCRWATQEEQQSNRRNNVVLEFQGRSQALPAWSKETGIPLEVLRRRIKRGNAPVDVLTAPLGERRLHREF